MTAPHTWLKAGALYISPTRKDVRTGNGERPKIQPKVFEILLYLAERADQLVDRETLLNALWAGRVVEANALNQVIKQARLALQDSERTVLITHAKRGFALSATICQAPFEIVKSLTSATTAQVMPEAKTDDASAPSTISAEVMQGASVEQQLASDQRLAVDQQVAKKQLDLTTKTTPSPTSRRASYLKWLALGLVLVIATLAFYQQRQTAVSSDHADAAGPKVLYLAPSLANELAAILERLGQAQGWQVKYAELPKQLASNQFGIAGAYTSSGLLLQKGTGPKFVAIENALDSLLEQWGKPSDASATDELLVDRLFSSKTNYNDIEQGVAQQFVTNPGHRSARLDAYLLARLRGQQLRAALLKPSKLEAIPSSAMRLVEALDKSGQQNDFVQAANDLKALCSSPWVAPESWAAGVCALELASAVLRSQQMDQYAPNLALAESIFVARSDPESAELARYLRSIISNDYALDAKAALRLQDARATGLLLRALAVHQPEVAFALGNSQLNAPWLAQRSAERIDVLSAMDWAARTSDAPELLTQWSRRLEIEVENAKGETRDLIRALLSQALASMGETEKAGLSYDAIQSWPRPTLRCIGTAVLISSGRLQAAQDNLDDCMARANEPSHSANLASYGGWFGKISLLRYQGKTDAARAEFKRASESFLRVSETKLNFQRMVYAMMHQAWSLRETQWIKDFCASAHPGASVCQDPEFLDLLYVDQAPNKIRKVEFTEGARKFANPGSYRYEIYLEQQRSGKCPLPQARLQEDQREFAKRGDRVTSALIAAVMQECANATRSKTLDQWRDREFSY